MLSQVHQGRDSSCMLQVRTVADLYFLTCSRSPFLDRKQHSGSAPLSGYTLPNSCISAKATQHAHVLQVSVPSQRSPPRRATAAAQPHPATSPRFPRPAALQPQRPKKMGEACGRKSSACSQVSSVLSWQASRSLVHLPVPSQNARWLAQLPT